MKKDSFGIIDIPFGCGYERVFSRNYFWNNNDRSDVDFVIIQRTQSGCGIFDVAGDSIPVPAGHALIAVVPEQTVYRWEPSSGEPWEFAWINLYGRFAVEYFQAFRRRFGPVVAMSQKSGATHRFYHLARLASQRAVSDRYLGSVEAYGFMIEWMREMDLTVGSTRNPVDEVARACETRFREPLSVKGLANEVGLTREHLTRLFVGRHGIGPAEYLRNIRRAEATTLSRSGRLPSTEVAMRAGFPSVSAMKRTCAR
jgi:AraC-like DNA-binding protein